MNLRKMAVPKPAIEVVGFPDEQVHASCVLICSYMGVVLRVIADLVGLEITDGRPGMDHQVRIGTGFPIDAGFVFL